MIKKVLGYAFIIALLGTLYFNFFVVPSDMENPENTQVEALQVEDIDAIISDMENLVDTSPDSAASDLFNYLKHNSPLVRSAAAQTLLELGQKDFTKKLHEAYSAEKDKFVKEDIRDVIFELDPSFQFNDENTASEDEDSESAFNEDGEDALNNDESAQNEDEDSLNNDESAQNEDEDSLSENDDGENKN